MLKYLRIAVTALSLTACVLLVALWVRSHYFYDDVRVPLPGMRMFDFTSFPEHLDFHVWNDLDRNPQWEFRSLSLDELAEERIELPTTGLGFYAWLESNYWGIRLPHWFLVLLTSTLATLPWLRSRFSVRTLLIATTLVAVVLGVVVAAM